MEKVGLGRLADTNVVPLDFQELADNSKRFISGTASDLVRDGYDSSHPWMMNAHADPTDKKPAFLLGRGWSATLEKRQMIADAGIPVMAINDYPADGPKPKYWCAGDGPSYYGRRIWDDPDVIKFSAINNLAMACPREDAYAPLVTPKESPNTHFVHPVNNLMEMESWLHVPYIAWGTSLFGPHTPKQFNDSGAGRSSMLIGLRLLWHLGYREVFMLGCDCTPHHHPAPNYWKVMFHYIDQLKQVFLDNQFGVYQCNPDSHLRTFPIVDFYDVLSYCLRREINAA